MKKEASQKFSELMRNLFFIRKMLTSNFYQSMNLLNSMGLSIYYIIPPIPPMPPGGIIGSGSEISATIHSVVKNVEATDVAF